MTISQKVVTVDNTDVAINAEIATQNGLGYAVTLLTLFNDDSSVIILFTNTGNPLP